MTDDLAGAAGAVDRLPARGQLPKGLAKLSPRRRPRYAEGEAAVLNAAVGRPPPELGPARRVKASEPVEPAPVQPRARGARA